MSGFNVATLPKWAQARIAQLERQVIDLDKRVDELTSTEVTDTKTRSGSSLEWYSLPSGQEYEFAMGDEDAITASPIQVQVRKEWDGRWLAINAKHGGLVVTPRSSNLIYVRGES